MENCLCKFGLGLSCLKFDCYGTVVSTDICSTYISQKEELGMYRKDLYHLDIAMGDFVFLLDIAVPKMVVTVIPTYFVLFTILTYSALSMETLSKWQIQSVLRLKKVIKIQMFSRRIQEQSPCSTRSLHNVIHNLNYSRVSQKQISINSFIHTSFEIVIKLEKMELVKQPLIICHFCGNHQIVWPPEWA